MSPFPSRLVTIFFFFLMVGFVALFLKTSAVCGGDLVSCNNGDYIGYPFSFSGDFVDGDCGYPGLTVNCSPISRTTVSVDSNSVYYLLQIDYRFKCLIVVRKDVDEEDCPRPARNFTLPGTSPFSVSHWNIGHVIYFYNCSSGYPKTVVQGLSCLDAYYSNNDNATAGSGQLRSLALSSHNGDSIGDQRFNWYTTNCQEAVVVPAKYLAYTLDLKASLKLGFYLDWATPDECKACEKSGGQCWYHQTAGVHAACSCPQNDTDERKVFDKVCPDHTNNKTISQQQPGMGSIQLKIIFGLCSTIGGLLLFILFAYRKKVSSFYGSTLSYLKSKFKSPTNVEAFLKSCGCLGLQRYTYTQVKKMTNTFKEMLGKGGFGSVYKGKLPDGRFVAVKVLNRSNSNGEDFMNEVATIGWTNHVNVVRLLGFCNDGNKQALVYEFMANGSLEKFICIRKNVNTTIPSLGWEKLYQIALGIAKGLEYLHCGCNTRIVHFDIKPHNILLDQDFCPKISDFGLAQLCQTRESTVSMGVARGTVGYVAPEIIFTNVGKVSHKSDVYSYGRMVLEIIAGRKNIDLAMENLSEIYFPQWIYNHLKREIDLDGNKTLYTEDLTRKMIMVALWCIQTQPSDRPSISKVVEMLEGIGYEIQMPPNPFEGST